MGIVGINPNAELYSLKVFDEKNQAPLSRIIEAIQYSIDNHVKILNMSFGTTVNSMALHMKIMEAYDAGILMVAAAGNKGVLEYPAAYNEVMAVGASTTDNSVAVFSPIGVEIVAPGTSILTTSLLGGYAALEGTSLSAPHVVAAASLLWAKDTTKSGDFIRQLLNASTRQLESDKAGNGLLDISNAFEIYEQFESAYEPNKIMYDEISENYSVLESFEEAYVIGSWGATGHNTTITDSGYLLEYVEILKSASKEADTGQYAATTSAAERIILHGGTVNGATYNSSDPSKHTGQNYVSNLRYLYEAACQIYNGSTSVPATTIYPNVSSEMKAIAEYIMNKDLGTGTLEKTKEGKAAKILGYAIHMAGDTYAHRTLVPISAIAELNKSNFVTGGNCDMNTLIKKQAFLKTNIPNNNLCDHYDCLIKAINAGVIETKDITVWGGTGTGGTYEDNTSFIKVRFNASKFSVRYIMGRFRTRAVLNNSIFLPDNNNEMFGLDLNGLYKFYQETGWSTTNIPKGSFSTTANDYTRYLR